MLFQRKRNAQHKEKKKESRKDVIDFRINLNQNNDEKLKLQKIETNKKTYQDVVHINYKDDK